jgi:hypothetical protein
LIAGAVQPDHQAIADQRIGPNPLYGRQVAQVLGMRGQPANEQQDARAGADPSAEARHLCAAGL